MKEFYSYALLREHLRNKKPRMTEFKINEILRKLLGYDEQQNDSKSPSPAPPRQHK